MTKEDVKSFMQKIKANYQEFSIEDYVVKTWYEKLKLYDMEDVYAKLEKHLKGEYKSRPPRLQYIVEYLKTPEEKAKSRIIMTRCMYCDKILPYEDNDKHLARHNSIKYIKSKEHLIDKNYNEDKLLNADESTFNKIYYKFLDDIYQLTTDEERDRLDKFIFDK